MPHPLVRLWGLCYYLGEDQKMPQHYVYLISSQRTPWVYIGTTSRPVDRMNEHRSQARCYARGTKRSQCTSRHIIKHADATMSILETLPFTAEPCDVVNSEARWIELIRGTGCQVVNQCSPGAIARGGGVREYDRARSAAKYAAARVCEKVVCSCGGRYLERNSKRHNESARHRGWSEAGAGAVV